MTVIYLSDYQIIELQTINSLINYEDGQEEPDSLRMDKIYALGSSFPTNWKKHYLKKDTNSERSMKLEKELRSYISGYRDVYKHLTNRPSSQRLIDYFIVRKINQLKFK
ncbi:uncharacterized protein TNCV_2016681 [Trichonephila clavipes]|nr:uncharacterized protein TNCV_2016681 [Trichonephila clavipes]